MAIKFIEHHKMIRCQCAFFATTERGLIAIMFSRHIAGGANAFVFFVIIPHAQMSDRTSGIHAKFKADSAIDVVSNIMPAIGQNELRA